MNERDEALPPLSREILKQAPKFWIDYQTGRDVLLRICQQYARAAQALAIAPLKKRIAELEAEIASLKGKQ